jgi:hypothetical protein
MDRTPMTFRNLATDIEIVRGMMIVTDRLDLSRWLGVAFWSGGACQSEVARSSLREAIEFCEQFGFPWIAQWIRGQIN